MTKLVVNNLLKSYKSGFILNPGSFQLVTGCYGFIGSNGSGKTELLSCIGLVSTADQGTWALEYETLPANLSIDYRFFSPDDERRNVNNKHIQKVQLVYQEYPIFEHMSVRRNISLSSKTSSLGDDDMHWVESLGLSDILDKKCHLISGGQKQRVAICRAILCQPKLLIIDEPTSAQDIYSIEKISNVITQLVKTGSIVVVSSHSISFIQNTCSNYFFLKQGKIESYGTPENLRKGVSKALDEFIRLK